MEPFLIAKMALLFHSSFLSLPFLSPPLLSLHRAPSALINPIQPQVETTLVGEEVDANANANAGGVGEEVFTEEYVTGDVGMREYDEYSYRDYNEPLPETGEIDGDMGTALSAVTDEGGVSHFAPQAKNPQIYSFQPSGTQSL